MLFIGFGFFSLEDKLLRSHKVIARFFCSIYMNTGSKLDESRALLANEVIFFTKNTCLPILINLMREVYRVQIYIKLVIFLSIKWSNYFLLDTLYFILFRTSKNSNSYRNSQEKQSDYFLLLFFPVLILANMAMMLLFYEKKLLIAVI